MAKTAAFGRHFLKNEWSELDVLRETNDGVAAGVKIGALKEKLGVSCNARPVLHEPDGFPIAAGKPVLERLVALFTSVLFDVLQ